MEKQNDVLKLYEKKELKGIRKFISSRLSTIWQEAVHVTLHKEVEISSFYENRHILPYSLIDYLLYGLIETLNLNEFKKFNSHFDGKTLQTFDSINLGIATDHPKGLVVPVIHLTDQLSMEDFILRKQDLISRTKLWKQNPEELENGTFTVSNLGTMGIDFFTPILNPPQVAILGLGRVRTQLLSWKWEDDPSPKALLPLSLTIDHRVLDGADAARFLDVFEENFSQVVEKGEGDDSS